jgi:cytochrome c553
MLASKEHAMHRIAIAAALLAATPSLATAQQQQQFRRDYISECFKCHGDDGISKEFDVPHLAGQQEEYLFQQMKAFKAGKRPHKEMKIMSRPMSEQDMREIAAFFAALPRDPK